MKTIIKVFKLTNAGGRKFFFKVEMEGHHPDSFQFREVYKSLALNYGKPFFAITVTHLETETIEIDMNGDDNV